MILLAISNIGSADAKLVFIEGESTEHPEYLKLTNGDWQVFNISVPEGTDERDVIVLEVLENKHGTYEEELTREYHDA